MPCIRERDIVWALDRTDLLLTASFLLRSGLELCGSSVGGLLIWQSAVPENPAGRGGQARGEGLQNGGARRLSARNLRDHEAKLESGSGEEADFRIDFR